MDGSKVEAFLVARLAESRGSTPECVLLDIGSAGVIDSLEGVELVVKAEKAFDVTIGDKELSSILCRSIPALASLIRSKVDVGPRTEGGSSK